MLQNISPYIQTDGSISGIAIITTAKSSVGLSCGEVIGDQVTFCGYFLTIEKDEVRLIYQLAKDYLLRQIPDSNRKLEFFRNLEIARKCLAYLQNGALADSVVKLEHRRGRVKDTSRLFESFSLSFICCTSTSHTILSTVASPPY
jgi:hypothetical protein